MVSLSKEQIASCFNANLLEMGQHQCKLQSILYKWKCASQEQNGSKFILQSYNCSLLVLQITSHLLNEQFILFCVPSQLVCSMNGGSGPELCPFFPSFQCPSLPLSLHHGVLGEKLLLLSPQLESHSEQGQSGKPYSIFLYYCC